jgi:hypothetical protein
MIWAVAVLVVAVIVEAALGTWLSARFLRELRDSHAAALQVNGENDARRVLQKRDVDEQAKQALEFQKELIQSGGLFPDPEARAKKPHGV